MGKTDMSSQHTSIIDHRSRPSIEGKSVEPKYEFLTLEKFVDMELPSFCGPILKLDDPSLVTWIDFWAATPSGDPVADRARGESYADEAALYEERRPNFISCVIVMINLHLKWEHIQFGPLEEGFLSRLRKTGHLRAAVDTLEECRKRLALKGLN
jgi:hypothetical protein